MSDHNEKVIHQFKKQAQDFSNKNLSLSNEQYIQWMLSSIPLDKRHSVLDVAAGTGIISRAMAPFVSQVTSLDLSPDMIRQGNRENEQQQIFNIQFVQGSAENLPFEDDSFDIVICRLAFHHFTDPYKIFSEMVRCGKRDSTIAVIDMISPREARLNQSYNYYETLRDPSHVKALTREELIKMYESFGIKVFACEGLQVEKSVEDWLALTKTNKEIGSRIVDDLKDELSGGEATGLFPFKKENEIMFYHTYFKIIGSK
ncbi:class I SAM-dependent methyltransferase [Lentibacillus cibarius]|uniref:Class I SAM-dependent methyltransferase n=1 Tax=Lentibacillus cibarius TaxID=2583219 RepID=A0A549YJY5_9BACI|nr:class I SAM-dependent methyltransferase [Lentibacillus cibarius]TRM12181.1 class I SAM-dependent methyltransferase [Lentibacillus cibarius]